MMLLMLQPVATPKELRARLASMPSRHAAMGPPPKELWAQPASTPSRGAGTRPPSCACVPRPRSSGWEPPCLPQERRAASSRSPLKKLRAQPASVPSCNTAMGPPPGMRASWLWTSCWEPSGLRRRRTASRRSPRRHASSSCLSCCAELLASTAAARGPLNCACPAAPGAASWGAARGAGAQPAAPSGGGPGTARPAALQPLSTSCRSSCGGCRPALTMSLSHCRTAARSPTRAQALMMAL
mmetsp:Transcript_32588/g.103354  ORF Transcript_32588/g.103354 Transcript_32588/m.103354 type:complete len:241 (-) Transcript_32588:184-906(-)